MAAPLEFSGAVPLQRQKSHTQSIMFIQQEHTKTLQALHDEIQRLQKRCSELTFSVAMGTTSSPQEDFYREKSEAIQKELNGKVEELEEATAAGEKKDKRIHSLEQQLRAQEKKYQDQIKNKEQQLRQMKVELTDKAAVNAELMLKRLSQSQEGTAMFRVTKTGPQEPDLSASAPSPTGYGRSPSEPADSSPVPSIKMPIAPHPPREGSGNRVRRRTSPRALLAEGEPSHSIKVRPQRVPSGRGLRRTSEPETVMPDPTPFLQREDTSADGGMVYSAASTRVPLPPISHHNRIQTTPVSAGTGGIKVTPQHVNSQAFMAKHKAIRRHTAAAGPGDHSSGSSSPEVEVLAVDNVMKRSHKMRRAQEYNTDYK